MELTGKTRLALAAEWRHDLVTPEIDNMKIVDSATRDVLDWVDVFIGTGGTGHTTPAATVRRQNLHREGRCW